MEILSLKDPYGILKPGSINKQRGLWIMGRQWTGIIGAVGVLLGTACPVFAAPNPFLQQEQLQQARQEQRKRMERLENPGER